MDKSFGMHGPLQQSGAAVKAFFGKRNAGISDLVLLDSVTTRIAGLDVEAEFHAADTALAYGHFQQRTGNYLIMCKDVAFHVNAQDKNRIYLANFFCKDGVVDKIAVGQFWIEKNPESCHIVPSYLTIIDPSSSSERISTDNAEIREVLHVGYQEFLLQHTYGALSAPLDGSTF